MAVYRFKVTFEDDEDIYREIEIKSAQSFEDFHNSILQSVGLDGNHNASFFISDDYWRKGEEVVLHNVSHTDKFGRKVETSNRLMCKCKMASLIDDPHQKFVYIYDKNSHWAFMVELLKIVPDDAKATYPKCVKTVGVSPKVTRMPVVVPAVMDDDDDDDIDGSPIDEAAYVNAHCEDGIAELTGEEGEEEETEEMEEASDEEESEFEDFPDQEFEED